MTYQEPIGKAAVLESFRDLTAPFIVLDYDDPNFEERAMNFIMDELNPDFASYGETYLLRSAGTFEGLLPYYSNEHQCYVGKTFSGLMNSPSFHISEDSEYYESWNLVERLKHQVASRFIQAGGGSDLERELFSEFEPNLDFEMMGESIEGKGFPHEDLVKLLREYSQIREIDLSQHQMRFILQKQVSGRLWHIMEHPNFPDLLYTESVVNDSHLDSKFPLVSKKNSLDKYFSNDEIREKSRLFSDMYQQVTQNLHPDFTYLVECIRTNDEQVIPVQATPVFRKFPIASSKDKLDNLLKFRGMNFLFSDDFDEKNVDNTNLRQRSEVVQRLNLDFSGKIITQVSPNAVLSHTNIRAIEGVKGFGKDLEDFR